MGTWQTERQPGGIIPALSLLTAWTYIYHIETWGDRDLLRYFIREIFLDWWAVELVSCRNLDVAVVVSGGNAGNVPNPGLTRGWQRNSSVRGADWIMGDGCHVMTRHCVTVFVPPPATATTCPTKYLHNPIFRGRSSGWTSAQKGRTSWFSITKWQNVGNKRIWRFY